MGEDWVDRHQNYSLFDNIENLTPNEREQKCVEFYEEYAGIKSEVRVGHEQDYLDVEPYIKSGDIFGTIKFCAGIAMGITFITGPPVGHSCVALRVDGELYVVQSNIDGITMRPYMQFVRESIETNNSIVIIPISKVSFGFAAGGSEFSEETIDEYIKSRVLFGGRRSFK